MKVKLCVNIGFNNSKNFYCQQLSFAKGVCLLSLAAFPMRKNIGWGPYTVLINILQSGKSNIGGGKVIVHGH